MIATISTALIALGVIGIVWCGIQYRKSNKAYKKAIAEYERSEQVFAFRMRMLHLYGCNALESLPSYPEMVDDTKELTMNNYLNPDKIVNLN